MYACVSSRALSGLTIRNFWAHTGAIGGKGLTLSIRDMTSSWRFICRHERLPPGFYRRLYILSTVDSDCAARYVRSTRLQLMDDKLPEGCFEVDRVVAKRASVVSACTVSD